MTPDGTHAYITDSERNQVVVLKTSDLRTVGRIPVGRTPWNTAFTADGSTAYVISTASNNVIDSTNIGLGDGPTGIAFG